MRDSLQPASNVTLEGLAQASKQHAPSFSTDDGMQIDESDEQDENACDFILESREPASNATLESVSH
jgi:hypothetical protein